METSMIKIQIDGNVYEVRPGKNLLQTCIALGFDITIFLLSPCAWALSGLADNVLLKNSQMQMTKREE